jgi:hypothetical protein
MLFSLLLATALAAPTQQVVLTDGQTLLGTVEPQPDGGIVLILDNGDRLPIPADIVAEIGAPPDPEAGPPDANRSRYFYGPSAFPLGKGHGYLAQRALVLSSAGYGIVDGWDIEVGSVLPTLFFPEAIVGFVGTKLSTQVTDGVRVMAGVQTAFVPEALPLMLGFAGVTVGDADRHASLTTGPGLGFRRAREAYTIPEPDGSVTVIEPALEAGVELGVWITAASYVQRLGPRVALVTENWFMVLPHGGPWRDLPVFVVPSGGVRLLAPRYAIDLGVLPIVGIDSAAPLIPIPWVSFDWAY